MNFIKIPNEMIVGERTIIKKYGIKALLVYIYLEKHKTLRGDIYLSLGNCIKECGFKLNNHKGKTNEQFRNILVGFKKEDIISTDIDLTKVKINDLIKCTIQEVEDKFFILTDTEIEKILNHDCKEDKVNILGVYAEIKARINRKAKGESDSRCTGHYEVAFPSYIQICEDTKIKSFKTLHTYLEILKDDLKMIVFGNNGGRVNKYTNDMKFDNNTYALNTNEGKESLKQSLKYFKQNNEEIGWEYKTFKDNRVLGGEKTPILKRIKNGTATEEDYIKLDLINTQLNRDKYKTTKQEEVDIYLDQEEIDDLM
ncbi:hypothetical protein [Clostridium baratii]|uniref:hypothetical protein n=1 Tax=Clostridium baratii TaxID=1561 RepID=UPI0029435716|nr:hypothetical protein [Clostridium baratii]